MSAEPAQLEPTPQPSLSAAKMACGPSPQPEGEPVTTSQRTRVSIVIPVYNERSTIEEVIRRVLAVDLGPTVDRELVVADDGSRDGTQQILDRMRTDGIIKVHTSLINLGKGAAIRFGLEYATGDIVLFQDADLELDPQEYPRLLEPILTGQADVVYGSRFLRPTRTVPLVTRLANTFLTAVTNLLYRSHLTDMETAYKVFRTDVLRRIKLRCVGFEFEPEVTAKVLRQGLKICEVPIGYIPRTQLEGKKIRWHDGLKAIYYLLRYRFGSIGK